MMTPREREILTSTLIYHYRTRDSGCGCGWGRGQIEHLGKSWPEHVISVYEQLVEAET